MLFSLNAHKKVEYDKYKLLIAIIILNNKYRYIFW